MAPERFKWNFRQVIFKLVYWLDGELSLVKLLSIECSWTLLKMSQRWFRYWLSAVRQQAITWDYVDPGLCRHVASLGHHGLRNITNNKYNMCFFILFLKNTQTAPNLKISPPGVEGFINSAYSIPWVFCLEGIWTPFQYIDSILCLSVELPS